MFNSSNNLSQNATIFPHHYAWFTNPCGLHEHVLVCINCNAHSTDWHCSATDARGEDVLALLVNTNLTVANECYTYSTTERTDGVQPNKDLALSYPSLCRYLNDGQLHRVKLCSADHRLISLVVDFLVRSISPPMTQFRKSWKIQVTFHSAKHYYNTVYSKPTEFLSN